MSCGMGSRYSSPSCRWRGMATSRPICEGAFCAFVARTSKQNENAATNKVGRLRGPHMVPLPRLGERKLERTSHLWAHQRGEPNGVEEPVGRALIPRGM